MGSDSFSPCCNTTILSTCEQLAACRAVFSGDYSLETNAGEVFVRYTLFSDQPAHPGWQRQYTLVCPKNALHGS